MKKILALAILGLVLISGVFFYINENEIDNKQTDVNYISLVYLKQAPNSIPREPDIGDIDTKITGSINGVPVKLYASRTWANNDYGKTFLWRDN